VFDFLQGTVAGVNIAAGGQPGENPTFVFVVFLPLMLQLIL
jgi:hypothetical protein